MKLIVSRLLGDATIQIFNKQGDLIHTEPFHGKTDSAYERSIPVDPFEYGHSQVLCSGIIDYRVSL